MTDQDLVAEAIQARRNAYAPYSEFAVGAAAVTPAGKVYRGCNVENGVYNLGLCAERVALFKAVSEGDTEFQAVAVATATGAVPCGACRQVLREFGGRDGRLRVLVARLDGSYRTYTIEELLPDAFTPDQLS
jgi:cytidine deaminase